MSEYLLGKKRGKKSLSIGLDENSGLSGSFQWYQRKLIIIIIMEKRAMQGIVYLRFVYLVNGERSHQKHHRSFPGASL